MKTQAEGSCLQTKERDLRRTNPADTSIPDWQPPDCEKINVTVEATQPVVCYYDSCRKLRLPRICGTLPEDIFTRKVYRHHKGRVKRKQNKSEGRLRHEE
jgi:hypothetical protein